MSDLFYVLDLFLGTCMAVNTLNVSWQENL